MTATEFRKDYLDHMHKEESWKNIRNLSVQGIYQKMTEEAHEFIGGLRDPETDHGFCIGSSIQDLVPDLENLYGKRINVQGLATRSYIALPNLFSITKVEVLNDNGQILEIYDSNEKSKTNLRKCFEEMGVEIPVEFRK